MWSEIQDLGPEKEYAPVGSESTNEPIEFLYASEMHSLAGLLPDSEPRGANSFLAH